MVDSTQLNTLSCSRGTCYQNGSEMRRKLINNIRVSNCIKSLDDDRMKRLLFLIYKFWQFFVPVLETDFVRVKVEILNEIVVRIIDLLKRTSTLKRQILVITISWSDTGWPYETVNKRISDKFFFILAILADFETVFSTANYL